MIPGGSLLYLNVTCLDITYVVDIVNQYMSALHMTHFDVVL